MKGQILEWNNGKGYQRGLLVADKQIKSLIKQGRCLLYLLDEKGGIKRDPDNGKKLITIKNIKETKLVGFQD